MKNAINYFYNLNPINIYNENNNYYFYHNNYLYTFHQYEKDIKDVNNIYNLNLEMLSKQIPVHQIILNKNSLPISTVNNKNYILYKIFIKKINKKINLEDINKLNNYYIPNQNIDIDWSNNWIDRIDYLEYQINQTGKKYPNLVESFSYFVGLSENAISYVKNTIKEIKDNNKQYSYSHRKLKINSTLFDLYDPCNIIIDYKVRDIAEYIKNSFFNDNFNIINELNNYFNKNYFSIYSIRLLFARLLYPSFYFNMYDNIITNKIKQEKITIITDKINDYENYLYEMYLYFKKFYPLPEIEWLKKTNPK